MNIKIHSLIMATGFAVSSQMQAQEWFPYVEAEGRVATDRSVVRGNIFAPIWQKEDSLFFFDIRGLTTNQDANEGNLGFGYRKLIGPDRLVGFFGYYDFRETEFSNQYHQGSLGAEVLSSKWGFRINGYLPDDEANVVSGLNTAFLSGNNVFVRQGLEAAYWGADIELERLLWSNTDNGKGGKAPLKVAEFDAEWWASVGYFHFDQSDSRFESISGPRARTELRLWNLPLLGNDSRIMLTGQYDYDEVRGSVGTAGLSVRIPIGRYQSTAAPLSGIRRRMLESVVRDIDIVTNAGAFGDPERAKFARTGELINGTVSVNGNTVNPEGVIEGAGDNSLVLADGSAGTIFPEGTIDMNTGQVILGGRSVIGVVGCDTGAQATFAAPGTRPTFRARVNDGLAGTTSPGFTGATNGAIIGVNFGSDIGGPQGIALNNVNNFLFEDVLISTSGNLGDGDAIDAADSSFVLSNSEIKTTGDLADGIDATRSSVIIRNSTIDVGDDGVDVNESTVTIIDSTIISQDDTLDSSDGSVFEISGSTLINNAFNVTHDLIDDIGGGRFRIKNSTFILNGVPTADAFQLDQTRSFEMSDSTVIINNGASNGFSVTNVPVFTIANSSITHRGVVEETFDFDFSVNSTINFDNVTVFSVGEDTAFDESVFDLDTIGSAVVNATISDSTFTGFNISRGVFGPAITSNDASNLTLNFLRTDINGSGVGGARTAGILDMESRGNSTFRLNLIDSTITSLEEDGIEDLNSFDTSTFHVNIVRSAIRSSVDPSSFGAEAIDDLVARGNSTLNVSIIDSQILGSRGTGDGIETIAARDSARLIAAISGSTIIGGINAPANRSAEGIESIETFDFAFLDLTIRDSQIRGTASDPTSSIFGGPAIGDITASGASSLRYAISGSTLTTGANAYGALLRAEDTATVTGSWTNNRINTTNAGLLVSTSGPVSTINLEATGNVINNSSLVPDIQLDPGVGTINVVDFFNLSPNNNGARIGFTGPINNITTLP